MSCVDMGLVKAAAEMLESALQAPQPKTFETYRDPGAPIQCPAVVIGPPELDFDSYGKGPTNARFLLYAIVDANERAVEILWEFVEEVANIIDSATDAVVLKASPAVFVTAGNIELPCYEIIVEAAL